MAKAMTLTVKNRLTIAFIVILIIPVLITGQISYKTAEKKVTEQVMNSSYESVGIMNRLLTNTLEASVKNVAQLAEQIDSSLNEEAIRKYIDPFQSIHSESMSTYLGTETGLTFISPYAEVSDDYDPRTRPWYIEPMAQKGEVYITEPYLEVDNQNNTTGNVIVSIAKAVKDGSGVVGMDLNLASIGEDIRGARIGKDGYIVVLDKGGKILIHPTLEVGKEIEQDWVHKIINEESNQFDFQNEKLFFETNDLTGWKIVGIMSKTEISDEVTEIYYKTVVVILISIVLGGLLIVFVLRSIIKPLMKLVSTAKSMGEGDLSVKADIKSNDEIGILAETFNNMREVIRQMLLEIREKVDTLAAFSAELTASSEEASASSARISETTDLVSTGAVQQVSSVDKSSITIANILKRLKQIQIDSNSVSLISFETSEKAKEGNEKIKSAVKQIDSIYNTVIGLSEGVQSLGEYSKEIEQIIGVITGIADQTNLLALNAAIEAARAGEHGRGFSVVADEVGKLAVQAVQSTQQISTLVQTIQSETQNVISIMDRTTNEVSEGITIINTAGKSFGQIENSVYGVSEKIGDVTSSIHEISEGTQSMLNSINLIKNISEESASGIQEVYSATEEQVASMEQIHSAAASLSELALELQAVNDKFNL